MSFLRDLWLDVEVVDHKGNLDQLERVVELSPLLLSGERPVALPTQADQLIDRGLDPGQSRTVEVTIDNPAQVSAHLRFRAIREQALVELNLADRHSQVPILTVATARWTP